MRWYASDLLGAEILGPYDSDGAAVDAGSVFFEHAYMTWNTQEDVPTAVHPEYMTLTEDLSAAFRTIHFASSEDRSAAIQTLTPIIRNFAADQLTAAASGESADVAARLQARAAALRI